MLRPDHGIAQLLRLLNQLDHGFGDRPSNRNLALIRRSKATNLRLALQNGSVVSRAKRKEGREF